MSPISHLKLQCGLCLLAGPIHYCLPCYAFSLFFLFSLYPIFELRISWGCDFWAGRWVNFYSEIWSWANSFFREVILVLRIKLEHRTPAGCCMRYRVSHMFYHLIITEQFMFMSYDGFSHVIFQRVSLTFLVQPDIMPSAAIQPFPVHF